MPVHLFPRRVTSTATTLTVNAAATTALQVAAQAATAGNFYAFTGNGLSTRVAHSVTGTLVDPTEDGQGASGNTAGGAGANGNKTAIDWCGKGCYDSDGKQVMWAGTGAFGSVADTPINTMAVYDETGNAWSAVRSWTAGGETSSDDGTGHTYDSNCIDPTGRRFFKRKFSETAFYVRSLTSGTWSKVSLSGHPSHYGDCGMDYIPSRDRLWIRTRSSSTNNPLLLEVNPTTGATTTLINGGGLGTSAESTSVCSFNPRAFGGVGGVFAGGTGAITVRADTVATQTNTNGKPAGSDGFSWSNSPNARLQHVCRDPSGDGWLFVNQSDRRVWKLTSSGTWTQGTVPLPSSLQSALNNGVFDFVMVPIDAYGVVWIVMNQGWGAERAWLYKP